MSIDFNSVKRSYGRCVITGESKKTFFTTFYNKFLASDPAIKAKFETTEFEKQITMLKNAISMAILYVEKQDDLALDVLTRIRHSHSRARLDINPKYYKNWLESLIDTLKKCDPQFNVQLEADWRDMLTVIIDYIKDGYDE